MPDRKKLSPHPLVSRLRPTAARADQVTAIQGWPGDAESADRVRVYLDVGLTTFYEFSADDVVDSAPVDPANENAPSMVWVRSGASAHLSRTQVVSGEISVLSGGISRANLSRALGERLVMADRSMKAASGDWTCPIETLDTCPTVNIFCPTGTQTMESWCTIGSWC